MNFQLVFDRRNPDISQRQPTPFTLSTLFPLYPKKNANDKLSIVLTDMREYLTALSQHSATPVVSKATTVTSNEEVERLQGIITALRDDIGLHLFHLEILDSFIDDKRQNGLESNLLHRQQKPRLCSINLLRTIGY